MKRQSPRQTDALQSVGTEHAEGEKARNPGTGTTTSPKALNLLKETFNGKERQTVAPVTERQTRVGAIFEGQRTWAPNPGSARRASRAGAGSDLWAAMLIESRDI